MSYGLEKLLTNVVDGLMTKKDFKSRWCEKFSEDCVEQLRDYGYTKTVCAYKCEYCNKFKWVVERAKHYEEKLGIPWEEVLSSWEKDRSYWYMNYYQDGNQPLIEGEHVRVFDTLEEFLSSVSDKQFRCPACGGISSDPYECNSGLVIGRGKSAKPCDWKVYGLFGDMGKGCYVYIKDMVKGEKIFMPLAWEVEEC